MQVMDKSEEEFFGHMISLAGGDISRVEEALVRFGHQLDDNTAVDAMIAFLTGRSAQSAPAEPPPVPAAEPPQPRI